jgi:hypothetical protein
LYAVDRSTRSTVAVYKQALGSHIYRLDDRETVEPLDEKWFVTLAGDVLERVAPPADSPHVEINV